IILQFAKPYSKEYFQFYPFGSDFTDIEQVLIQILLPLKNFSKFRLICISVFALFCRDKPAFHVYLERMKLKKVKSLKDYYYKKLVIYLLRCRFKSDKFF